MPRVWTAGDHLTSLEPPARKGKAWQIAFPTSAVRLSTTAFGLPQKQSRGPCLCPSRSLLSRRVMPWFSRRTGRL